MVNICLAGLVMLGGVIKGPFRIADTGPYHHQVALRTAMAYDGRFAVAWLDSLQLSDRFQLDLYIRFFDKDGNPLTDAYKIPKILDTTWVNCHALDMDSAGNAVLVWTEGMTLSNDKLSKLRFMSFSSDGTPLVSSKSLYTDIDLGLPLSVSLSNNGRFAMSFETRLGGGAGIWLQRFDLQGNPLDSAFLAHDTLSDSFPGSYQYAKTSMNEAGDIVVTWLHAIVTAHMYPFYQVFDANDNPVDWDSLGHRVDNGDSLAGACVPKPFWLDNDRIAMFWYDYCYPWPTPFFPLLCRVFTDRGQAPQAILPILSDTAYALLPDPHGQFSISFSSDERFAYTHNRTYAYIIDSLWPQSHMWEHQGGMLGKIVGNEAIRSTNLFEYTPPYGDDTVWSIIYETRFKYRLFQQSPVTAASDDRIVWVYTRFQTDTVFEAYAIITDWDMGVGVAEPVTPITPPPPATHLEIANAIGSSITLRYSNCPNGFSASVYDASGRRVDELRSSQTHGTIQWGGGRGCYGPGVYFIVPQVEKASPSKVVLVK